MSVAIETPAATWGYAPGNPVVPGLRAWARLGGGRRCETWLAWSQDMWSPVVVKLPRPDHLSDPATRADLAQEAEMMGALSHPAVQRLYAANLDADPPHLVFEYVEGPTLADSLAQEGPLAPGEAAQLGLQVAGALRYLHGHRVVHLDLKPDNICLRDGRPVLIDFGIARRPGQRRRTGAPRGSPPYMAPEQCLGGPAVPATDLFALGAVLFEAVTGQRAYHPRRDGTGWWYPQLAGSQPRRAPGPLGGVIRWLIQADPANRPPDADAALKSLAVALPAGEDPPWPPWSD